MLSSVTLADKDGSDVVLHSSSATAKRVIMGASGLFGVSAVRQARRARPNAHGEINQSRYTGGKLISLQGEISSDVSIEDAISEFRTLSEPMLQTLDYGAALLKWTEGSAGLELQCEVKLADALDPPITAVGAYLVYQAQLLAEDPRAYSQDETSATGIALSVSGGGLTFPLTFPFTFATSGGGTVSIAIAGNRPTPPRYRIYGAITDPQIVILGADSTRIVLSGAISAGDYLDIDVNARTVLLNGETNYAQLIEPSTTTWAELPAGETTNFQLVGSDFDANARLDVFARDAYA